MLRNGEVCRIVKSGVGVERKDKNIQNIPYETFK